MNACVLAVGSLKEKWQKDGANEYLKRLTRYGKYEMVEVPDEPEPAKPSKALNDMVMDKEGKALLSRIKPADKVVALCIEGKQLSSEGLAEEILKWEQEGHRVVFVIGGSLGLSKSVTDRADYKLSFSKMTFPHPLMRVILLEQLYRAARINAGERYHK
ncbi:MAG: 23S rRNA (pseudouridine(1915)-N(3))-methyltransferase RlmH [Clostridia bacterium]|nr:23S rRNA (pseudouridine(1915)-N(3))-methyltransferase RlmH [Clostridiales bacterium]MBQ6715648.1 23S rRNA (pseudouridine(1915)-N(3))-methyltransferase RlmH [Clostridia bacterium]